MELLQRNGYRLRAPEPEDLAIMQVFENTPSLWEVSSPSGPYSRYHLKQYLESCNNDLYVDRQLRLMIESTQGEVVGIIDLFHFDPFHSRAEVGIVVAEPHCDKGVGRLALDMLIEHCFRYLGLHQLYAHIDTDNTASLRLFKACGFLPCGILKGWMRRGTSYSDVEILQLINA